MDNKKLFYVTYSGGVSDNFVVVAADNHEDAEIYAYQEAKDDFFSYVGLHGILDYETFLEEEELYDDDYAEEQYNEYIEDTISYSVTPYSRKNVEHIDVLEYQSGKPFEI